MAKVLNPLNSSEARGRVGGLVYNTWRGIRTVKTHTNPSHQSDPKRQAHKLKVQEAGIRWQTLTDAQRAAWNHYADQHPDIDWTGRPVRLAGYHWYVRINVRRLDLGLTYEDNPPIYTNTLPALRFIPAFEAPNIMAYWYVDASPPAGEYYVQVWCTHQHSAGRNPTTHEAYVKGFADYLTGLVAWEEGIVGYYTLFARSIRKSGITSPWASGRVYVPY